MGLIQDKLNVIEGHLIKIEFNEETGRYHLEVGFPNTWVYQETNKINLEVLLETENSKLIKVSSDDDEITTDELIEFIILIIETNYKIIEMQEEFDKKLEDERKKLEEQVKAFYETLDNIKTSSLTDLKKKINKDEKTSDSENEVKNGE